MKRVVAIALVLSLFGAAPVGAYPLDATPETGITRLDAFWLARAQLVQSGGLKRGSLRPTDQVRLGLLEQPNFSVPPVDKGFSREIRNLLGGDAGSYGVTVLDLTDPSNPRFAEVNGSRAQNPGSVGKIMVLLAWFQALAEVYPDDIAARERVLKEAELTANQFIRNDEHKVPVWKHGDPKVLRRPIQEGDTRNVNTYLDWMASASSNAAASMMMSQLILLKHFGKDYPVSQSEADAFFKNTPKSQLTSIFQGAMRAGFEKNGIDGASLRQGSFFTRNGKSLVPSGMGSTSTSNELVHYLTLMEQGKLVDRWSSVQIKRFLYLTDVRIRYASSPALDDAAVYFKSGSLYGCKTEPGFQCGKYMGNRMNYMNSIAVVEEDVGGRKIHYVVAVLSNVLRKNSVDMHIALAAKVHETILATHRGGSTTTPMAIAP